MLTSLRVRNFKRLLDVEIDLGQTVLLIGPNNSGKTTALQALALWKIGLDLWRDQRGTGDSPKQRPGVTINRRDLISIPVPSAVLLWRDLRVRKAQSNRTENIRMEIHAFGQTASEPWDFGLEFDYANSESLYCRPLKRPDGSRMTIPEATANLQVAFLPPMSGLAAVEDKLTPGAIHVRIGEGRTAEVLRNLCFQLTSPPEPNRNAWQELTDTIHRLFGVELLPPEFMEHRGQITMAYKERGAKLDLSSAGRGLQQTLLLPAHLYSHPNSVLLLDEPDAHLEILRQRQIYQILTDTARQQNCQIIAASHSEVLLNEAADRDVVVAFIGQPHRIDDRGSQAAKSLKEVGFEHYYQAEQKGWVLFLEGSTDLAILRAFAHSLQHPARDFLEAPYVCYVANSPSKARDHFRALREAKKDLIGVAIFDDLNAELHPGGPGLAMVQWRQREIENYLCSRETLLAFASDLGSEKEGDQTPLIAASIRSRQTEAMQQAIDHISGAIRTLGKPDPFGPHVKASDDFLDPLFAHYFKDLGLPNEMRKTGYHVLARFVPTNQIDAEVTEKLDLILSVASQAKPLETTAP